ncbi:MAG: hypothetical protein LPK14_14020 [Hymenobacteraceae bacterium]|nr:hypothetical protein [Hymenobacteraceae bacterium]
MYRNFEDWERDELTSNLCNALACCDERIQKKSHPAKLFNSKTPEGSSYELPSGVLYTLDS